MSTIERIAEHGRLVNAIKDACNALAGHLGRLPDPQSADEAEALLRWRWGVFSLSYEPAADDVIRKVAPAAGEMLAEARDAVIRAARELLSNIETVLAIDARANKNGLFSPDALAPESFFVRGEYAYTRVPMLPTGHPLRSIGHDEMLPEICIGPARFVTSIFSGKSRYVLDSWKFLKSFQREVEAMRAESDRRREAERQQAQEQLRRQQEREEQGLPPTELRLRRLEERLSELRNSPARTT
jgi:voltage-gated potassium channel Kch